MRDRYSVDRNDRSGSIFAIVAAVAFALLAWVHFSRTETARAAPEAVAESEPEAIVEPPRESRGPSPSIPQIARPRPSTAAAGQRYVGVYECVVNGQRVVSDRPCGPGATARVLEVDPPKAPPPPVPVYRPSTPITSSGPRSSGGAAQAPQRAGAGNDTACAAVDRAIDELNARMRQRYSSQEGEYLRAQWHALKERRYDLGCGR